jgi:hypothetical protein
MTKDDFRAYCFVAALKKCLDGDRLRDEERKALEDTIEETFINMKVEYVGMTRLKEWFVEYKIRRYGIISERIDS